MSNPRVNVVLTDGTLQAKGRLSIDVPDGCRRTRVVEGRRRGRRFRRARQADVLRPRALEVAFARGPGRDARSIPRQRRAHRSTTSTRASSSIRMRPSISRASSRPAQARNRRPTPSLRRRTPRPAREALPISIGHIELARGNVNFSDFYIKPNYSANLTDVTGSVGAMSAEQAGELNRPRASSTRRRSRCMAASIRSRRSCRSTSPRRRATSTCRRSRAYSAKYAGYGIEKGQLTFDVHYQVENRKLSAENRLVLDQLTFGPRVESPTATKLPVLLAVALLKNSRGVIDIRLPISGSLDDPKFSRRRPHHPGDRQSDHQGGDRAVHAAVRRVRRRRRAVDARFRAGQRGAALPMRRSASTRSARRSPTGRR